MPKIKPIDKLVTKARSLRDHHRERHTPSGFAFALADSIDYLDQAHWRKVTPDDSLFFSPRYLRVLEEAGPENLRQCYALIFREKEPVAAVAAQCVSVSIARLRKTSTANDPVSRHEEKMLVCGWVPSQIVLRFYLTISRADIVCGHAGIVNR